VPCLVRLIVGAAPLARPQKAVFGHDSRRHPITGRVLEQGSGAHPEKFQAEIHCRDPSVASYTITQNSSGNGIGAATYH
jgi:hypothetical protein